MANTSARIEIKILLLYLIVTYTDRQEALDIPSKCWNYLFLGAMWGGRHTQQLHFYPNLD